MFDPSNPLKLIIQAAAFVLVLALWLAGVLLWWAARARRSQRIHQRLGLAPGTPDAGDGKVLRLWHEGQVAETVVGREADRSFAQRLDQLRQDAGWSTPIGPILGGLAVGVLLLAVLLLIVTRNVFVPVVVPVLVLVGFKMYLQRCINRRTSLFERQLVDALDLGSRSLRAGHPLSGAFRLVAEEVAEPVGGVFGRICEQEALGVGTAEALERSAADSRSPDMQIFAASVVIQLRSGGNLADMIERVTWVIRERMRLNRRARVLTAEAQLSKWVLLALPLGMFLLLNVINPEYMQPLYTTDIGRIMLVAGGVGLLLGSWVMGRMSALKY